jgi:hypothetical protein
MGGTRTVLEMEVDCLDFNFAALAVAVEGDAEDLGGPLLAVTDQVQRRSRRWSVEAGHDPLSTQRATHSECSSHRDHARCTDCFA